MSAATALVNHGRWIAHCPRFSELAFRLRSEQRGWACGCGARHLIDWPDDRAEIEKPLRLRPSYVDLKGKEQRPYANWFPHESVGDLWAENVRAGVSDLDDIPEEYRAEVGSKMPTATKVAEAVEVDGRMVEFLTPAGEALVGELPASVAALPRLRELEG